MEAIRVSEWQFCNSTLTPWTIDTFIINFKKTFFIISGLEFRYRNMRPEIGTQVPKSRRQSRYTDLTKIYSRSIRFHLLYKPLQSYKRCIWFILVASVQWLVLTFNFCQRTKTHKSLIKSGFSPRPEITVAIGYSRWCSYASWQWNLIKFTQRKLMPYHRVMVCSRKIDRTINVHETGFVVRSYVSWIDLQSFKVNSSLVP